MTKVTKYAKSITQSLPNNNYVKFNNIGNLKNNKDTYSKTDKIEKATHSSHRRPAKIHASKFGFNIPAGSTIKSVTVEYAAAFEGDISIASPIVDCTVIDTDSKKGKALTKKVTNSTITWKGNRYLSNINAEAFGVTISFASNTKYGEGYVKLKYLRIIIDYTAPKFSISAKKTSGKYTRDHFKVQFTAVNSNKTLGSTNVTISLPSGVSYEGKVSGKGSISVSSSSKLVWKPGLSGKVLSAKIVLQFRIMTDGNHNISMKESSSSRTSKINVKSIARPVGSAVVIPDDPDDESEDESQNSGETPPDERMRVSVGDEFDFTIKFTNDEYESMIDIFVENNPGLKRSFVNQMYFDIVCGFADVRNDYSDELNASVHRVYLTALSTVWADEDEGIEGGYSYTLPISVSEINPKFNIFVYDTFIKNYKFDILPSEEMLPTPFLTVFRLSEEECNRLGHGYAYTVLSNLKLITNEEYVRQWEHNFRIGVMNNINPNVEIVSDSVDYVENDTEIEIDSENDDEITVDPEEEEIIDETDYENLSLTEIFEYAEYWSDPLHDVNEFENSSVEFVYNENYPVYIILTGDYPYVFYQNVRLYLDGETIGLSDPTQNSLLFTEPCVIDSSQYAGREPNGNFVEPILNVLDNSDSSEITLKRFEQGNDFIVYDFPLDDDFSTSENFAIVGVEVTADVDYADECMITAKLRNNNGTTGERSIKIGDVDEENDEVYSIALGGKYDLWGFKIKDMLNFEKWEVEFNLTNLFENSNEDAIVKLKNIQIVVYVNTIKSNVVSVYVDDENVRHKGMFVTKVIVPEGIETDTKYLTVENADTNWAYRMNIRSKEITLEFSVRGCNLTETTELLRQLARLFVNDRDELDNPIPKKIEFSHYPDVYFLYIMEEPFDVDPMVTDYTSKIKLIVPDGTAFAKQDVISGKNGINKGLAKVNPIITFIPDGDVVEITETVTNQAIKISYKNWSSENTVEIDCINRTITILDYENPVTGETEELDITEARDFNSDWFYLNKEYVFEEDNCIIQTVQFTERW